MRACWALESAPRTLKHFSHPWGNARETLKVGNSSHLTASVSAVTSIKIKFIIFYDASPTIETCWRSSQTGCWYTEHLIIFRSIFSRLQWVMLSCFIPCTRLTVQSQSLLYHWNPLMLQSPPTCGSKRDRETPDISPNPTREHHESEILSSLRSNGYISTKNSKKSSYLPFKNFITSRPLHFAFQPPLPDQKFP